MEAVKMNHLVKEGVSVRNAGIVLLNSYIPMLLERLKLIEDRQFVSIKDQKKAVKYLQYVVTGLPNTDEIYLPLNKLLCGLSVDDKVPDEIEISQTDKMLVDGLLNAVIGYWTAIGDCSIDGFRGNWLVRNGLLVEFEDKWELTVEKRVYDILILRSPFAYSVIKFPWMEKPLHVYWNF
ncbi:contractile injection system tape measure protein [Flavobacterium johnsoniae]|uniref:Uncharacterized protein n=1 Tax=Flavobacterium johnsoniae TaxID=986 RepID=A0A1J7BN43_FLAJO|nr:contractile injection system tape measure protein [Flavobacterium johnsoniae]OIV40086.1 hypothetical protein BKM63_19210 [Flavobacterium johnsoniae]